MTRILRLSLLVPALIALGSCAREGVARLDAAVVGETAAASTRAGVNFTRFSQPPAPGGTEDGKLRLSFSNPEGDTMQIVLSLQGTGFPVASYYFDNSGANTFQADFSVMFENSPVTYSVTSVDGFINVESILLEDGYLKSLTAHFNVNFDPAETGSGFGWVNVKP